MSLFVGIVRRKKQFIYLTFKCKTDMYNRILTMHPTVFVKLEVFWGVYLWALHKIKEQFIYLTLKCKTNMFYFGDTSSLCQQY